LAKLLRAGATFIRDLCYDYYGPKRWLSLIGTSGAGKTHMAKGIYRAWEGKGRWFVNRNGANQPRDGYYWDFSRFINEIRSGHYGVFDDCRRADFLILDDVGAGHSHSTFAIDKLYELLNERLGKWTVLTSNLTLTQFQEWDQRIASRLIRDGNECVETVTKDFATRKL